MRNHQSARKSGRLKRLSAALLAIMLPLAVSAAPMASGASGTSGGTSAPTSASEDEGEWVEVKGGFTTIDLAINTLEQLPACLEYKITGITLRMVIRPWGVYFFWTPHVEHYSPDLVSMSHPELNKMPWIEYSLVFGEAYKQISQLFFARVMSALFNLGNNEIGGGRYLYNQFGKHQSVQFTESTVVGHPVAAFLQAFTFSDTKDGSSNINVNFDTGSSGGGGGGGSSSNDNKDSKSSIPFSEVAQQLSKFIDGIFEMPVKFREAMGYKQVLQFMANSPVIQSVKQLMMRINQALASVGGHVGNSPFCPVNATPFDPYYLSGLDAYLWRMGYPIADSEKSLTILNPFSFDRVAPSRHEGYEDALINLPPEVEKILTPKWGNIYPREGALNQPDTSKHGAVIASRSQSLLGEGKRPIGRIFRVPQYHINGAAWSKMYPKITMCHRNIANTGADIEEHGRYAWTIWTSHDCDLSRRGIPIVTIPLGPIYVTPAIPE
ncbi:MAG: hypothetical protein Q4A74_05030 [Cardiobacteriaceae bacterium]|nr:hypothetical protein [Cardiobacteriaceae bacterium]